MTLDPQDIAAIAAAVRLNPPRPTGLILTTEEAMAYLKIDSQSGFYQWLKRHKVECSGRGRYPAHRLEQGVAREARMKISDRCAPRGTAGDSTG
jgi:hypothetical protein